MTHPGILHFYIHLMEMSPEPELAQAAADALRALVPDAGHLVHMPTHIDVLVGDYAQVIVDNERAIAADDRFVAAVGALNFYTLYRAHDHHFRIYGAMFAGRREVALQAAAALEARLPEQLLRVEVPPMADWLESFVPMRVHVLVRFGMWDELIAAAAARRSDALLRHHRADALRQGSGAGGNRAGRSRAARAGAACGGDRPRARVALPVQQHRARHPGDRGRDARTARSPIGSGAYDRAWSSLRRAIELDDTLPYDEPWGWMQPTRHAYGALLLEQGEVEAAAAVYAADLGLDATLPRACRHPNNVWSLHGYHECLMRLGRAEDAQALAPQLDRAMAAADVAIESSCFCRTGEPRVRERER